MKLEVPKSFVTIHESVESQNLEVEELHGITQPFFTSPFLFFPTLCGEKKIHGHYIGKVHLLLVWKNGTYVCMFLWGDHLTMTNSRMEIRIVGCNVAIILSYGES
jgi:hypothetical protein